MAMDLLRGDSAIAELKLTQENLELTNRTVKHQQNIIDAYAAKEGIYKEQIRLYNEKETKYDEIVKGLEKDTRRFKRTIKVLGVGFTVTGTAAILLWLVH
jgi:hypothetical protein